MEKLQRKERGITLIALVITVIIMLILAGVAISVLTNDGGLFDKTRNAAGVYEQAAQNEADQIQSLMNEIDDYLNGVPTQPTESEIFINTNNKNGSKTYSTTYPATTDSGTATGRMNDYVVHPAFTWAKEDGTPVELEGIWVGKFETSSANASIYGISTNKDVIDPHLIKNTEWGAAAYLAHSKYGRNKIADESMSNLTGYSTGNGNYKTNVGLSTTGNVYGIYDMAGGAWEHTAAHVDSTKGGTVANSYLTGADYGKALYDAAAKYKDVYRVSDKADDRVRNYSANADKYGDGIYETSYTSYDGTNYTGSSWNGDHSNFPFSSHPFFYRGGYYANGAHAGVFAFTYHTGSVYAYHGFRAVLATL